MTEKDFEYKKKKKVEYNMDFKINKIGHRNFILDCNNVKKKNYPKHDNIFHHKHRNNNYYGLNNEEYFYVTHPYFNRKDYYYFNEINNEDNPDFDNYLDYINPNLNHNHYYPPNNQCLNRNNYYNCSCNCNYNCNYHNNNPRNFEPFRRDRYSTYNNINNINFPGKIKNKGSKK